MKNCPASAKLLVGRKVAEFRTQPFSDGRGGLAHDPLIVLDNGARLYFVVEETDVGKYGVSVYYHMPDLRSAPKPEER